MKNTQIEVIDRKILDDTSIVSIVKYDNMIVKIRSVFAGTKHIEDIFFNIAKDRINKGKIG